MKRVFSIGVFALLAIAAQSKPSSFIQSSTPAATPAPVKDLQTEAQRVFQQGQAALNEGQLDRAESATAELGARGDGGP